MFRWLRAKERQPFLNLSHTWHKGLQSSLPRFGFRLTFIVSGFFSSNSF